MEKISGEQNQSSKRGRGSIRSSTIHKMDMEINKDELKLILDSRGMNFVELHRRIVDKFGLDLSYKDL